MQVWSNYSNWLKRTFTALGKFTKGNEYKSIRRSDYTKRYLNVIEQTNKHRIDENVGGAGTSIVPVWISNLNPDRSTQECSVRVGKYNAYLKLFTSEI